jgi:hypothetical protein
MPGRYDILLEHEQTPPSPAPAQPRAKEELPPPSVPRPPRPARAVSPAPSHPAPSKSIVQPKSQDFDKYSTTIRIEYRKKLKMLALERECNDYDILDEALAAYFDSHKK